MFKIKRYFKKENGETFVEVLASVTILAIIAIPLLSMIMAVINNNIASKQKTEASSIAQMVIEEIKAGKSASVTGGFENYTLPAGTDTNFDVFYRIESAATDHVTQNKDNTYEPSEADNPDLELSIDQGESGDGKISSVELRVLHRTAGESPISISDIEYKKEILRFTLEKAAGKFKCGLCRSTDTVQNLIEFSPVSQDFVKLKISCKNGSNAPNADEQLRVFTCNDTNTAVNFKAYITDGNESDKGICFINKSGYMDYEINYMSSKTFDYANWKNQLLKITVEIRNKKGAAVYTASSYVKK
ncbi:MAG TPA: hypothetical protein VHP38_11185 [Ruminiclostridium sp.]|nr:hypothetical protein [Ruminiclostridium sp.]